MTNSQNGAVREIMATKCSDYDCEYDNAYDCADNILAAFDKAGFVVVRKETLQAFEDWFSGVALDHIPNEVFHKTGGYALIEALRAVISIDN